MVQTMSRSLLAALAFAALALALAAPPVGAQSAGGSLSITDLAPHVYSNQTTQAVKFHVAITLNSGTCVDGSGQFPVTLTATKTSQMGNGTVTLQVQPATINFQVPRLQTLNAAYTSSGDAVLLVSPGLVRENVTVPISVHAAAQVACNTAAGQGAGSLASDGTTTVHFRPVSEEIANGPTEALPGLGLPAMLAVIGAALLVARRRNA